MTSFTPLSFSAHPLHSRLIEARKQFLEQVAVEVEAIVPDAIELWCYGVNAMRPNKPSNDWDFIVILPNGTTNTRVEMLNELDGPLSDFRKIGNQTFDVQALRVSDRSPFARLLKVEGFCFWRKPITLESRPLA
jgi:hypothetical protein